MIYLTQIVKEEKYWEINDSTNMGYIPIYFRNEVRYAKPILDGMSVKIPSKEFIMKYVDSFGIYIQKTLNNETIWWTGFCLYKNAELFSEFKEEYPHLRINFIDETWIEYFSSKEEKRRWEVKSYGIGDYSSIKMDIDNNMFTLNNRTINGLQFQEDKSVLLEKQELLLGGYEAEEPALLGNKTKKWLEDLVDAIKTETHSNGNNGSPTGTPLNTAQYDALKQRIPEILSELIKISK